MAVGWVRIYRELWDEYGFFSQPFCKNMAWIDLIMLANYAPGTIYKRGITVNLNRGDMGVSQDELAKRWRWSRGKVIRFLDELETKHWIVQQGNNVTTCITIVEYEKYQNDGTTNETVDGNIIVQRTDEKQYLTKKKEVKKKENTSATAPPAPVLELKTEIDTAYVQFNRWMDENAPRVRQMKKPITLSQYLELKKIYSTPARKKLLFDTLSGMDNYQTLLKKYVSAYTTVNNWAAKEIEKNPTFYQIKNTNDAGQSEQQTPREQQAAAILKAIN